MDYLDSQIGFSMDTFKDAREFLLMDPSTRILKISSQLSHRLFNTKHGVGLTLSDYYSFNYGKLKNSSTQFTFPDGERCRVDSYDLKSEFLLVFDFNNLDMDLKRYALVFQQISNCMIACDETGKIIIYNPAYGIMDGLNPEEVIGKDIIEIYDLKRGESSLTQAMESGKPLYACRQQYRTRTGKNVNSIKDVFPLIDQGRVIGAVANVHDIEYAKIWAQQIIQEEIKAQNDENQDEILQFDQFEYHSESMKHCVENARFAAKSNGNVCIYGSEGTGKGDLAQYIISKSSRKNKPHLIVDFASIPQQLIGNFLFGHQENSSRGDHIHSGFLQNANTGTLILKNIDQIPSPIQYQLLNFIRTHSYFPVDSIKRYSNDVRFITLLSCPIGETIASQSVHSELLYALNSIYLQLPALRTRIEDVPILSDQIIRRINKTRSQMARLSGAALRVLMSHQWDGNYIELCSAIANATAICPPGQEIGPQHLPEYVFGVDKTTGATDDTLQTLYKYSLLEALEYTERAMIGEAMHRSEGNISKAASHLGIQRQNLQYRKKKLGL